MNSRSLLSRSLVFHGNRPPHLGNERVLHALRRLTGADVNENLDIERRGRRWVLNPSDFVQGDVFRTGYKDYWDVWHLERLLPANAAIADVGANFGYYAIELCLALGPLARAVAFEPFPASFARLEAPSSSERTGGARPPAPARTFRCFGEGGDGGSGRQIELGLRPGRHRGHGPAPAAIARRDRPTAVAGGRFFGRRLDRHASLPGIPALPSAAARSRPGRRSRSSRAGQRILHA